MNLEVELKYRIKEVDGLKEVLDENFPCKKDFHKLDYYYLLFDKRIRIREDKKTQDTFLNYKDKNVKDGFEVNQEVEFKVENKDLAEEFLFKLGAGLHYRKEKIGQCYKFGSFLLEFLELKSNDKSLGFFLEIETIFPCNQDANFLNGKEQEIKDLACQLGLEECDIEGKPYHELVFNSLL